VSANEEAVAEAAASPAVADALVAQITAAVEQAVRDQTAPLLLQIQILTSRINHLLLRQRQ
jgi:hypothetical protein